MTTGVRIFREVLVWLTSSQCFHLGRTGLKLAHPCHLFHYCPKHQHSLDIYIQMYKIRLYVWFWLLKIFVHHCKKLKWSHYDVVIVANYVRARALAFNGLLMLIKAVSATGASELDFKSIVYQFIFYNIKLYTFLWKVIISWEFSRYLLWIMMIRVYDIHSVTTRILEVPDNGKIWGPKLKHFVFSHIPIIIMWCL